MVDGDYGAPSFHHSPYHPIFLQPPLYISQPKADFTKEGFRFSRGYHYQHLCKNDDYTTGGKYRLAQWRGSVRSQERNGGSQSVGFSFLVLARCIFNCFLK